MQITPENTLPGMPRISSGIFWRIHCSIYFGTQRHLYCTWMQTVHHRKL